MENERRNRSNPFPTPNLRCKFQGDEHDSREWKKEEEEGEKIVLDCRGCELDWRRL